MPILVTISTVTYLFLRGSSGLASFLDPAALRKKLEELPEGSARTQALVIADRLDTLARAYDQAAEDTTNAYLEDVVKWTSSASALIKVLEEQDQVRVGVLRDLVPLRQNLLETLSPEEWDQVFST